MSNMMTIPVQKAEKLPETSPERMVNEDPPSREAVTTSLVCLAFGEVNIFVNSGMSAAPKVPQEMIREIKSHKFPISFSKK